jgi:putative chitinase
MATADILTTDKFQQIFNLDSITSSQWQPVIATACDKYTINTPLRIAGFLSQIGYESTLFTRTTENLNYSAAGLLATFPSLFNSVTAAQYANNPQMIANLVYANKLGNGNEASGDGYLFRGRGLIQLTGRQNYTACGTALGIDFVSNPDLVANSDNAAMVSSWYWNSRAINDPADAKDINGITRRVNAQELGIGTRETYYNQAILILTGQTLPVDPNAQQALVDKVDPDKTTSQSYGPTPPAVLPSITEPNLAPAAGYPWNKVFTSRSGHIMEFDDTPGQERINLLHRMGSYQQTTADGTYTNKSVADKYDMTINNWYGSVGGNGVWNITGQFFLNIATAVIKATADIFLNAGSSVQVNAPKLSFSDMLVGPQSDIDTGHFKDLAVDNTIQGTIQFANYINFDDDDGHFNFQELTESLDVNSTTTPTWVKPVNFTQPAAFTQPTTQGVTQIQAFDLGEGDDYVVGFKNKSGQWIALTGTTPIPEGITGGGDGGGGGE